MSGHRKKSTEGRTLTLWRQQRERLVKTRNEIDRGKDTHSLGTAEGATCQDTERNRPREGHSQTGDGRGSDLSEHGNKSTEGRTLTRWRRQRGQLSDHGKKSTEGRTLTSWRQQRERLVRTRNEIDRGKDTHSLKTAEGANCQDTKRNRPRKGHSLPGDGRGSDLSRHRKKSTEGRTLTN